MAHGSVLSLYIRTCTIVLVVPWKVDSTIHGSSLYLVYCSTCYVGTVHVLVPVWERYAIMVLVAKVAGTVVRHNTRRTGTPFRAVEP